MKTVMNLVSEKLDIVPDLTVNSCMIWASQVCSIPSSSLGFPVGQELFYFSIVGLCLAQIMRSIHV